VKFFLADSLDQVDPSFDFVTEERSPDRIRQRDDRYAHEIFGRVPYDGMLVSKAIVDGVGGSASAKYSIPQRQRLYREGVRDFLRLPRRELLTMGDCGAFTYVREELPPYTPGEVVEFYETCGFDFGISLDHVILGYDADLDGSLLGDDVIPPQWRERQALTLALAEQFLSEHRRQGVRFEPMGVAQAWSPESFAKAVHGLQAMGYRSIAMGGLVPLRTRDVLASLAAVESVRLPSTRLHLLGITRLEAIEEFARLGVASFDSTSPLRQAFKDDRDNYFTLDSTYVAIRVPQVDGNPALKRRILAGEVDGRTARIAENACLEALRAFDAGQVAVDVALLTLQSYDQICGEAKDRSLSYRRTLMDAPWRRCECEICRSLGIEVIIFRGAERNRRRGFHNVWVFHERLAHRQDASLMKVRTEPYQPVRGVC
jgi:hypothetical protein